MPSPFPGMDPFLEHRQRWPLFHGWFMRELARFSLDRAKEAGLWIDVERSIYHRGPRGEYLLVGEPDAVVGPDFSSASDAARSASGRGGAALATPQAVHEIVLEEDEAERIKQDYLVVRELGRDTRVLAVVELLSYANKSGGYVPRYREKRDRFIDSAVHFMEIDLLRFGENPSRDLFPELPASPYFVFVARKTGIGRNEEGYPIALVDPLPAIGLPVGPGRADLPLDLTAAFRAAYELAIRPGSIDYREESVPPPEISPADIKWVARLVRQ
ncbi:MAG: DUF4058 family protein [Pirellulales bacterium]